MDPGEQLRNIVELEQVPLSDVDVKNLMDGHCNVHLYRDLKRIKSVDELLGPYDCCMILFEWQAGYGHWICLSKHGDLVEYFDPYGKYIDYWLQEIDPVFAKESNQNHSYLSRLLIKSPYELSYNEFPFQKRSKNISTCGRWSVVRGILKDMSLNDFKDIFLNMYGDKLATLITS